MTLTTFQHWQRLVLSIKETPGDAFIVAQLREERHKSKPWIPIPGEPLHVTRPEREVSPDPTADNGETGRRVFVGVKGTDRKLTRAESGHC